MTLRGVIVSIIMTIVLCIMTLGYAALQQRIDIEGQADIDSTYRVEITSVQQGSTTGDARSTNVPQYNGLSASFYVGLTNTELGSYANGSNYNVSFGSTNDYSTSNVSAIVNAYMLDKGMTNYLKTINNYKIRLITKSELNDNLGWINQNSVTQGNEVPVWAYSNFGENSNGLRGYWTMTAASGNQDVYIAMAGGRLLNTYTTNNASGGGVRPVINLYKSAIE